MVHSYFKRYRPHGLTIRAWNGVQNSLMTNPSFEYADFKSIPSDELKKELKKLIDQKAVDLIRVKNIGKKTIKEINDWMLS